MPPLRGRRLHPRPLLVSAAAVLAAALVSGVADARPAFGDACSQTAPLPTGLCCCPATGLVAYGQRAVGTASCMDTSACAGNRTGYCAEKLGFGETATPIWRIASKSFCTRGCPCCVKFAALASSPDQVAGRRLLGDATRVGAAEESMPQLQHCDHMDHSQCPVCRCCPVPIPMPMELPAAEPSPPVTPPSAAPPAAAPPAAALPPAAATPLGSALRPGRAEQNPSEYGASPFAAVPGIPAGELGPLPEMGEHTSGHYLLGEGLLAALGHRAEEVAPQMTAQHIILMLNASAKLGWQPQETLLDALRKRAETVVPQMTAQNIASILTAYAQIGKDPGEHLLAELMTRAEFLAAQMSPEQVANSLNALAVMGQDPTGPLMTALGHRVEAVAPEMSSGDIANTLDAFARMRKTPKESVRVALEGRTEALAPQLGGRNVSTIIHAYAVFGRLGLGAPRETLVATLMQRAHDTAPEMGASDVARVLEGYQLLWQMIEYQLVEAVQDDQARMKGKGGEEGVLTTYTMAWKLRQLKRMGGLLLKALGRRAEELAGEMDAKSIALTMNAYSQVGESLPNGLDNELSARIKQVAPNMSAPDLATIFNAIPNLGQDPELTRALERRARNVIEQMSGQDVAHSLNGYTRQGLRPSDPVLSLFGQRALHMSESLAAMDAATILDACATVWPVPYEPLIDALEQRLADVAGGMGAAEVARVYRAVAKLRGHIDSPMLIALSEQALKVAQSMTSTQVASVFTAQADLGVLPGQALLAGLAQRARKAAPEMTAKEVSSVMSAYAMLWREHSASALDSMKTMPKGKASNAQDELYIMGQLGKSLIGVLGDRAEIVAPMLSATDVALILDAFASLHMAPSESLLVALGHRAQQVVESMSAQDVAMTLRAYAALKVQREKKDIEKSFG